jgi:hypothetical protein
MAEQEALFVNVEQNLMVLRGHGVDPTVVVDWLKVPTLPHSETLTALRTLATTAECLMRDPPMSTAEAQHRIDGVAQLCTYAYMRQREQRGGLN